MSGPPRSEIVPAAAAGERLDRFVTFLSGCSRSEAAQLIRDGGVRVDGSAVLKGSHRVAQGDRVELERDPRRGDVVVEADPSVELTVVHQDEDVIVIDKPADLVVHPAPGHPDHTLVNGLLAQFPELREVGEPKRAGLVHRLDRRTSGLLVVARSPRAYDSLVAQLAEHSAQRTYSALVLGHPQHDHGVIDAPIGRSHRDPMRMVVAMDGREARTHYRVEQRFSEPRPTALLSCDLETGRTHQIRVHLSSIGHPVVGDDRYGGSRPGIGGERPFLHARRLSFTHPGTGDRMSFDSPLPPELVSWLGQLG